MTTKLGYYSRDGIPVPLSPAEHAEIEIYENEVRTKHRIVITTQANYLEIKSIQASYKRSEKRERKIKRGEIVRFSRRSSIRFLQLLGNVIEDMKVFITLTYPSKFPTDGTIVKYHRKKFIQQLRYRGHQIVWCLEFQKRGAPHFHILSTKVIPHEEVARMWYKIVNSGDPKHLEAGTQVKAITDPGRFKWYVAGYLRKWGQKKVPEAYRHVGRFWGVSRGLEKTVKTTVYTQNKKEVHEVLKSLRTLRRYSNKQYKRKGSGFRIYNSHKFIQNLEKKNETPFILKKSLGLFNKVILEENKEKGSVDNDI